MFTFSVAGTSLGDCRFDLLLNRRKVERRSLLHRRKLYCCLCQLTDLLLHIDEAPEFTRVEVVEVGRRTFSKFETGIRSKGSCLMFSRIGMLIGTFGPGQPSG